MAVEIVYLADNTRFVHLCAVWAYKTWGRFTKAFTLEKRIESFTEHSKKNQIPLTILALDDGRAVGMASLRPNDGIRPDLTPWLGSVFVDPLLRKQGLGQRLVEETCKIAKDLGYPKVYLLTYENHLPSWYSKFGWKAFANDLCHGNDVTVMEIDLAQWVPQLLIPHSVTSVTNESMPRGTACSRTPLLASCAAWELLIWQSPEVPSVL